MLSKVANVAAFQLTWWAAVLGAASSKGWIGPAVAACILPLTFHVDSYFAPAGAAFRRSTV